MVDVWTKTNNKENASAFKFFLLLGISVTIVILMSVNVLGDDYTAYWKFDGNSNDESGNYHGVVNGATLTTGQYNQAYSFDGVNDYIENNTLANQAVNSSFSVSFWIKPYNKKIGGIVSREDGSNRAWYFKYNDDEKIFFGIRGAGAVVIPSNEKCDVNNWCFIVGTYSNPTFKLYINGELDDSNTGDMIEVTAPFRVGRYYSSGNYFNGSVDEVRYWTKELTSDEVLNLYNYNDQNDYSCLGDIAYTSWVNISYQATFINQSRTRIYYDTCEETTNTTQYKILLYNWEEVQQISNLNEVIKTSILTFSFVFLWLGLWIFGYYAFQTANSLIGGTMIVLTVPINIYFAYFFREVLNTGTGFLGIAFTVLTAWTFGMIVLIRRKTYKKAIG